MLVERVFTVGRSVRVRARTCGSAVACPECGVLSRRVHSRYERRLLDAAAGGRELMICLSVRRFLCLGAGCAKVTFAEQVPRLTSHHARRSPGLSGVLEAIALAAGARLSGQLTAGVSRMTLIRMIRALPDPAFSGGAARAGRR
jgi:zinc-finger of transposase IS204/IS1001/IS1096/IS1165